MITETRDDQGNVLRKGDTVECIRASHITTGWYPQVPGEQCTVREVVRDGLYLEGYDHSVDASRFVKVQPVPTCCTGEDSSTCCPGPDATGGWPALAPGDTDSPTATSVLLEAQRAVYGDRGEDYGHPREDFTRQAVIWTGLLQHKLADGEYITPEDVGRCMIGVKLARDVNSPKRDNRVDMAGYALCLDRLETGK